MALYMQIICTAAVCYLCTSMGLMFAWPSCVLELFRSDSTPLSRPMSETEIAFLGSLSSVGALISTPIVGIALDKIGRKYTSVLSSLTHVIAWSMISLSTKVEVLLAAIFVSGIGGGVFLVVPVFVGEICQEQIRGSMTSGSILFYSVGIFISYLIGAYMQYKTMVYSCLTMAVVGTLITGLLKESPTYLMQTGKEKEAAKSIAFYRSVRPDSKEVLEEINNIKRTLNPEMDEDAEDLHEIEKLQPKTTEKKNLSTWKFMKKSSSTRWGIFISLGMLTISIFQGLVVVQVYAEPLFESAIPATVISPKYCLFIFAAVTILSGVATAYLSEVLGRKLLMVIGSTASGFCCLLLGTQIHLDWGPSVLTAIGLNLFCFAYNLGPGTMPFVFIAEVFLPEVRSILCSVAVEWAWFCNFIILFIFNPLVDKIGLGPLFYVFAAISFLNAAFCMYFQPETMGVSLEAIQLLLTSRKKRPVKEIELY